MKRTIKSTISIILTLVFVLALVSCNTADKSDVWQSATYHNDMELGNGAKTVVVAVKAGEKQVTFTVRTDKDTVGAALLEHGLISGEEGQYGLYLKAVNGMTADYDIDMSYWAFYINGDYALTGVDTTEIVEGENYELVYTK